MEAIDAPIGKKFTFARRKLFLLFPEIHIAKLRVDFLAILVISPWDDNQASIQTDLVSIRPRSLDRDSIDSQ